jgi:hypothetical protein
MTRAMVYVQRLRSMGIGGMRKLLQLGILENLQLMKPMMRMMEIIQMGIMVTGRRSRGRRRRGRRNMTKTCETVMKMKMKMKMHRMMELVLMALGVMAGGVMALGVSARMMMALGAGGLRARGVMVALLGIRVGRTMALGVWNGAPGLVTAMAALAARACPLLATFIMMQWGIRILTTSMASSVMSKAQLLGQAHRQQARKGSIVGAGPPPAGPIPAVIKPRGRTSNAKLATKTRWLLSLLALSGPTSLSSSAPSSTAIGTSHVNLLYTQCRDICGMRVGWLEYKWL